MAIPLYPRLDVGLRKMNFPNPPVSPLLGLGCAALGLGQAAVGILMIISP